MEKQLINEAFINLQLETMMKESTLQLALNCDTWAEKLEIHDVVKTRDFEHLRDRYDFYITYHDGFKDHKEFTESFSIVDYFDGDGIHQLLYKDGLILYNDNKDFEFDGMTEKAEIILQTAEEINLYDFFMTKVIPQIETEEAEEEKAYIAKLKEEGNTIFDEINIIKGVLYPFKNNTALVQLKSGMRLHVDTDSLIKNINIYKKVREFAS